MQPGAKVNQSQREPDAGQALGAAEQEAGGRFEWTSEQLFGRAQEVGIRHDGHLYRLRRTKLGKLILTK